MYMKLYKYNSISEWADSQGNTRTAVRLAESGIPTFPVKQDKTPDTAHGYKDATTNPTRIAYFFRKPGLLLGMPTGLRSNIDVIDEDPKNGGNLADLGSLPMDVVAQTRSGGRHVFFKHRDGIRNTTGLRPGIDVRGEGGYVVLWAESDAGEWISGDLTSMLPDFPVIPQKEQPGGRGATLQRGSINLKETAFKPGERNTNLFKGLCSIRSLNRPIEEALEWAQKAASDCGGRNTQKLTHSSARADPPRPQFR